MAPDPDHHQPDRFFHDPASFEALQGKVVAPWMASKAANDSVRVWVCGCGSGEEAYSIAIVVHEQVARVRPDLKVQIFATDADGVAIAQARAGLFAPARVAEAGEQRLQACFDADPQHQRVRVKPAIRDLIVFSQHDPRTDPPFCRLDLVACRGVLAGMPPQQQRSLIARLHYALVPGGALWLGPSDRLGDSETLFQAVDRKAHLSCKLPTEKSADLRRPQRADTAAAALHERVPALALSAFEPMLLEEMSVPFDDAGWLFEIKYDGMRLRAEIEGDRVELMLRDGTPATRWFPEVAAALYRQQRRCGRIVLDGEICVPDEQGRTHFACLEQRMREGGWATPKAPAVFWAFDLLCHRGRDLRGEPLEHRKRLLHQTLGSNSAAVRPVPHVEAYGHVLFGRAAELGLEGIVAKRLGSPYRSGQRCADWVKIKLLGQAARAMA